MCARARQADFDALPAAAIETVDLAALRGRTILITGATGFVGSWLLEAIRWMNERGLEPIRVHAVARRPGLQMADWITWTACDVRELPGSMRSDFIIHAALPSTSTPAGGAAALVTTSVAGTSAVLEHASGSGAQRVLVLSSGAVYGGPHHEPITEGEFVGVDPTHTGTEYAVAKLAAEALAAACRRDTGVDVSIARLFTCIGAGYRSHAHLAHVSLIADAHAGRPIRLRSSGRAVRSYLFGADLAIWLLAMISREAPIAMNVGGDRPLTVLEFAHTVAKVAGRSITDVLVGEEPDAAPGRTYFVPDISLARRTFGLEAWTSIEDAVQRTMAQL